MSLRWMWPFGACIWWVDVAKIAISVVGSAGPAETAAEQAEAAVHVSGCFGRSWRRARRRLRGWGYSACFAYREDTRSMVWQ